MALALDQARPRVRPDDAAPPGARCQSCGRDGLRLHLVNFGELTYGEPTFAVCAACAPDPDAPPAPWEGSVADAF